MSLSRNCCRATLIKAKSEPVCLKLRACKSLVFHHSASALACRNAASSTAGQRDICGRKISCRSTIKPATTEDDIVRYASIGDIVSVHFLLREKDGKVVQSSATDLERPLCFEVGAGDMVGNRLFQGFDEAVRGMAVGQTTVLEASGGEWRRELLFSVPRDHPEVQRLEGRYKNQGGLAPGLVVELSNNSMAVVLEVTDSVLKLDANNMMAGKTFTIELELLAIDTPDTPPRIDDDE